MIDDTATKTKSYTRMRNRFFIHAIILLGVTSLFSCSQKAFVPGKDYSFADMVQTMPLENVQSDSVWTIWCGSMVKGYDEKYHLYYSRWPRKTGHEAWISHSQIAYAVGDKPEGPYRHVNVPLPATGATTWDGAMTHNPYIVTKDGKYYLYYVATQGEPLTPEQKVAPYSAEWWKRRNTQRVGVAVADNPAGPWRRLPTPVLTNNEEDSTAFDAMCVANPAICVGRGGKMVMLYKAVCKNGTTRGGKVRFSVAFADCPEGPFVKTNRLIFQPADPNAQMVAEDPYIWYDEKNDMYYSIVRDVIRQFTGKDSGGLALMQSQDAIDWIPAPHPKVLPAVLKWSDGTTYDADKNSVERPFLYRNEKGIPQLLLGTFSVHNNGVRREHTFNGRVPLEVPKKK